MKMSKITQFEVHKIAFFQQQGDPKTATCQKLVCATIEEN